MSKSKKINCINDLQTLTVNQGSRYFIAWREDIHTEDETETVYHLDAGYDGMPADYNEKHDTLQSLEASMREVANLRCWTIQTYS